MDKESLKPVIESLIFAADRAISVESLSGVIEGAEKPLIRAALKELVEEYRAKNGGLLIEEVAGGFQFRTNPEAAPWIRRLFKIGLQRISKAAMETLAIVAYKQPATRGELEAIRGVDSGAVLATLMDKRLIKITGRKEAPGRPVVYGTTKEFLETFDLKDLSCLPSLKDIQRMEEENAPQDRTQAHATPTLPSPIKGEGSGGPAGEAPEGDSEGRDNIEKEGRDSHFRGEGNG
ncbi:MAG: SMC-Scp complex subunit ScpB [Deltaproteobacteria bacterium]|nr:SMC-Scp complex subunit ScpB [Deltaproteobacteria bacterium]